jgi:phage tail sheath protein FI
MSYRHGAYVSEAPTSVIPPVQVSAGIPVVFGTAPINLAADQSYVNKPFLAYSYAEAVAALGYSDDWTSYTLCEFMKSHFALYHVSPVVFVNVLDPSAHVTAVAAADINMANGVVTITTKGVLLSTLVVKLTSAGSALAKGTDYTAAFDDDGQVVITPISGGLIASGTTKLNVAFSRIDATKVTKDDVIGGVDSGTGAYEGLELINKVFPMFGLVPGSILAPGWSSKPDVAAVMKVKSAKINGLFKAMSISDMDDTVSTGVDLYSEAPAWKNTNNYVDPLQIVCWPEVKLGTEKYHLSTQVAGAICLTDSLNDDIPFVSPSNKALQCDSAVLSDGREVVLGPEEANYLNGAGIVTALSFAGGWKLWGNRTGVYPVSTDIRDSFIPVRRMFNWIGNTIILTYGQSVDNPTNKRLIETVVDSINIWLNGLTARGALLGGRVEFSSSENPTANLIDGIVKFHIYLTPPIPAEDMEFVLEFDTTYLSNLFAA